MNFEQLENRYRELVAQRQAGGISPQKFAELAGALRTQDAEQGWWQIDPASGHWLKWDGSQWLKSEPPRAKTHGAQPPPAPGISSTTSDGTMHKAILFVQDLWQRFIDRMISPGEFLRQSRLPLAQRSQGWWDVLGIAGGALSGYIWFLYSSIRGMPHFKLIGLSGGRDVWYDFIPSILLAALPFFLFIYRDRILARLDPVWSRVRMNVSYGMNLAAGIVVGALALNFLSPTLFGWAFDFREGLDFTTPLLMVGIPVGLAIFRPETDHLILPLQPLRQGIPKFLLVGVALAIPYALAFLLYRLSLNQYELLHWNLALGILIPYVLLRNPQPGVPTVNGAGTLRVLVWLLPILLLLSGTFIPEAFADDCARDIFNLRDCLRTGGYAETMSGAAASFVSVLVNFVEIARIFLPPEPEQFPPQGPAETPPGVPPANPPDIEWTSPDGRNNVLEWHPEKGGYINILTGGFVAPEDVSKWKQNVSDTIEQTDDWRKRNDEIAASGPDDMNKAMQDIADKYKAQQEQIKAESKVWKEWFKGVIEADMNRKRAISDSALESANSWDEYANHLEKVVSGADFSINVLATVTGPLGKQVKTIYTVTKDITKNLSAANAEGKSLAGGLGKGLLEAGFDLGFDKLKSTKAIQKIPGFGKYAGGKFSGESLGTIEKAITETLSNQLDDAMVKQIMIRNAFRDGFKSAAQSGMQKLLVKDPLKKVLGLK